MPADQPSQIVLITGTSSGFGLLTAARLCAAGHTVIATMRDVNKSGGLLDEVKRRNGEGDMEVMQLDVTRPESIRNVTSAVAEKYGTITTLINNAGFGVGGFFEDLTDAEIRSVMETNFFGVQNVIRAAIPLMRQNERSTIINISSIAGLSASPAFGAYNASKWALEGFSEGLRYELAMFGIRVCLIEPGSYKTRIFYENARYAENFDNPESPYYATSQFLRQRVQDFVNDLHKDPEEVAALAERLINAENPPLRNIPDWEARAQYALRRALPLSWYMGIIRQGLMKGFKDREMIKG